MTTCSISNFVFAFSWRRLANANKVLLSKTLELCRLSKGKLSQVFCAGTCRQVGLLLVIFLLISGIYFTLVIAISGLSVIMSVIVLNVFHRSSNHVASPMPDWVGLYVSLVPLVKVQFKGRGSQNSHLTNVHHVMICQQRIISSK